METKKILLIVISAVIIMIAIAVVITESQEQKNHYNMEEVTTNFDITEYYKDNHMGMVIIYGDCSEKKLFAHHQWAKKYPHRSKKIQASNRYGTNIELYYEVEKSK